MSNTKECDSAVGPSNNNKKTLNLKRLILKRLIIKKIYKLAKPTYCK